MAEYIEAGLQFKAMMIFLSDDVLKSFVPRHNLGMDNENKKPCVVFPANQLVQDFKVQFRQYFNHRLFDYRQLIPINNTKF